MDWTRAIEINRAALMPLLARLVAGMAVQAAAARLPLPLYRRTLWMLHKIESAVRRLIVLAACTLAAPPLPPRPLPAGLVIPRKAKAARARLAFQLFDTRQAFRDEGPSRADGPRIRVIGDLSPREEFLRPFARAGAGLSTAAQTHLLRLRLAAAERALARLHSEAKRLLRWQARRRRMATPRFTDPLRPGPPPGLNRHSKAAIDLILRECHDLAWSATRLDTS